MVENHYISKKAGDRSSLTVEAIKECDKDMFPNIFLLLQIAILWHPVNAREVQVAIWNNFL